MLQECFLLCKKKIKNICAVTQDDYVEDLKNRISNFKLGPSQTNTNDHDEYQQISVKKRYI